MPPGVDQAISAASKSGWEATMVAVVLVSFMAALAWIGRAWMNQASQREIRMASRIDSLENFQRNELTGMLSDCRESLDGNSRAVSTLNATLEHRPCLLPDPVRAKIINMMEEKPSGGS